MTSLRRKWRSINVRAGITAGLLVGLVALVGMLIVGVVIYGTLTITSVTLQTSMTERGLDQLRLGADPSALDVGFEELDADGRGFWAVLENDVVVSSEGQVEPSLFAAEFDSPGIVLSIESSTYPDLLNGYKSVSDNRYFVLEDTVRVEDTNYRFVSAILAEDSFWGFLREGLVVIVPLALLIATIAGLITALFTRRALRSVEKMRQEVEHITRESLDRRVPTTEAGDEIDRLARTMNDMLGRLESSSAQQGAFLAAASHELRSPVAGLLAQLEIADAYPDRVDTAVTIPKLRDEAQRLQLLVDDLLYLSRDEAQLTERPPPTAGSVALDEMIAAEIERQQLLHPNLTMLATGQSGVAVHGHERDLARAVRNLADNAARHAASSIEIDVSIVDGMAAIAVRDDGAGVAVADAQRIFDRFVRLDEARSRDQGGSGLGLAIVGQIARQQGGSVSLIEVDQSGATFQLLMPLAP